jgi:hypothetical protein
VQHCWDFALFDEMRLGVMKVSSVFGAARIDTTIYARDARKFAEVHVAPRQQLLRLCVALLFLCHLLFLSV